MEQLGNVFCVLHRSTENHRSFIPGVLEPSIHNELIPFWDINLALQVANVVLYTVEPHFAQVNIGMDTDTPHRNQFANLHSGLDVQLVGSVFEYFQNIFIIRSLWCGGETKDESRFEIR